MLAGEVAVLGADGKGRRDGDVGKAEPGEDPLHQLAAGPRVGEALVHVEMEHGAAGVAALEFLLMGEGLERVVGVADGKLGGVRVIWGLSGSGVQDAGELHAVDAGEAVGRPLGGRGLEVVEVARLLLIVGHALPHPVEQAHGEVAAPWGRNVLEATGEVADALVDPVDADRGEVVPEGAEVALGVGEESLLHVALDDLPLQLEALGGEIHEALELGVEIPFTAAADVAEPGSVERHHADRAGLFGRAEEAVAPLEQLAQVELEAAAHGADHARLEVGVEEVLEVRETVLGRHLEEQVAVLPLPGEVLGDVVGRDREGEDALLRIPCHHHLEVGAVDHRHFLGQLAVGEGHLFPRDEGMIAREILRAGPVEGEVGEGGLRSPAGGDIQVEDELLHALAHVGVGESVLADIRRKVGVEGTEGLRPGPLVLEGAEEVHHLAHRGAQVLRRAGLDLVRHAVEALPEELAERPSGAVTREHVEVVDVEVPLAVGVPDLRRVDVAEPVVGRHLAGDREDHTAKGESLIRIGVDPPVGAVDVLAHRADRINHAGAILAELAVFLPVHDVGARGGEEMALKQRPLGEVLDLLDPHHRLHRRLGDPRENLGGEFEGPRHAEFAGGLARTGQGGGDFFRIKSGQTPVALADAGGAVLAEVRHDGREVSEGRCVHRSCRCILRSFCPSIIKATIRSVSQRMMKKTQSTSSPGPFCL